MADEGSQFWAPDLVVDVRGGLRPPDSVRSPPSSVLHPAVVLLSRACDRDLDAAQHLLRRAGIPWVRLDADEATSTELDIDVSTRVLRTAGGVYTPTAVWIRHFAPAAIAGSSDHDVFVRESWQAAATALASIAAVDVAPVSPGLLAQLHVAQAQQVAVPRTVISTDAPAAGRALGGPRVVLKALHRHFTEASPGRLSGRFPRIVGRRDLDGIGTGPPVVVQEYVEHEAELRVYHLGGQVSAFAIDKEKPADPWTAPDRVGVRTVAAPPAVAEATSRIAAALGMHYGAFDFLIRDGVPVFLEANPDGDWRWIEQRANTDTITLGVAQLLADLHRRVLPSRGRSGSLDLLTFLA
ncbi:MAG: hypothetical protein HOV83_25315 [Catenulispora sp.]|nr:hypothetical protein [Catenulispora sp.]